MKRIILAAVLSALAFPAIAADVKPTEPPPAPKAASVSLDATDLQVALIAISNAGAACDIGVKAYCQLLPVRDATAAKLTAALSSLAPPAPAK